MHQTLPYSGFTCKTHCTQKFVMPQLPTQANLCRKTPFTAQGQYLCRELGAWEKFNNVHTKYTF